MMRKLMVLVFGLTLAMGVMMSPQQGSLGFSVPAAHADGMGDVKLVLKKLRESMSSMKDFDALEDAGMDKADVSRLRRAMKSKIKQMTSDAVDLIRAL
ncbi:MAG: hypothetical protein Q9M19_01845 [Mariprofundaceae bacterium]|nr:hypothetical protein [Mariprofundaceae bacterium]